MINMIGDNRMNATSQKHSSIRNLINNKRNQRIIVFIITGLFV